MAAAVQDRVRALGGVLGLVLARLKLRGGAVSLAMSALALDVDAVSIVVGFPGSLALGVPGVEPAAWRAIRLQG